MRLTNIRLEGNEERRGLRRDVVYAELLNDDGSIVIAATLEYVLAAIRDRRYRVDGVVAENYDKGNSRVVLSRY